MSADRVEELIEEFLARRLEGSQQTPAEFAAAHPEHAVAIERRLSRLQEAGLLEAQRAAPPLEVPPKFDGYEIESELGRGGMGVVFRARQTALGRTVALKVMAGAGAFSPRLRERFEREITTLARISHPNIVKVFGSGTVVGVPYVAMEFVEGEPLTTRLPPTGERAPREAVQALVSIAIKVARALDHAHELGVVHRDVKPGNVLIDKRGEPMLLDFGLARDDARESVTLTGEFVGTLAYTAPEQARGERVDRRADVFGLGATLYHLLTGSPPYAARSITDLVRRIHEGPPSSAARLNPALPRDLATVLDHAIEPDPVRRYASAADFADDLDAVLAGRPIRAQRVGALGRAVRWARRRPATASLLAVTLLAVVTGVEVARGWIRDRERSDAEEFRAAFDRGEAWLLADENGEAAEVVERRRTAREYFARCVELRPERAEAWFRLAESEFRLHSVEAATSALARAKALQPGSFSILRFENEWHVPQDAPQRSMNDWIADAYAGELTETELYDLAQVLILRVSDTRLPERRRIAYALLTSRAMSRSDRLANGLLLAAGLQSDIESGPSPIYATRELAFVVALRGYEQYLAQYPDDETVGFNCCKAIKDALLVGVDLGARREELRRRCDEFYARYRGNHPDIEHAAEWLAWRMMYLFDPAPHDAVLRDCESWLASVSLDDLRTLAPSMQEWMVRALMLGGRFDDARALLVTPVFERVSPVAGPLHLLTSIHNDHVGSGWLAAGDRRFEDYLASQAPAAQPEDLDAARQVLVSSQTAPEQK